MLQQEKCRAQVLIFAGGFVDRFEANQLRIDAGAEQPLSEFVIAVGRVVNRAFTAADVIGSHLQGATDRDDGTDVVLPVHIECGFCGHFLKKTENETGMKINFYLRKT